MFSKHKWPTFSGIILIVIMIISIFSFVYEFCRRIHMLKKIENFLVAFLTADNNITFIPADNSLTGSMVKVTIIK